MVLFQLIIVRSVHFCRPLTKTLIDSLQKVLPCSSIPPVGTVTSAVYCQVSLQLKRINNISNFIVFFMLINVLNYLIY